MSICSQSSAGQGNWWSVRLMVAAVALALAGATGCGTIGSTHSSPLPGASFQGRMFGGQQPVAGATIQLYAASSGGYGSASVPLIAGVVKTDASGGFTITGSYTCPAADSQVYLTGTGGDPGLGTGTNSNLALMAALGSCGDLSSATFINVNELTTVGSVWALASFMKGPAAVGTSATNLTGLMNAFSDVSSLVNVTSGSAPGNNLPAGAIMPVVTMNTLANILAACVNSAGGLAGTNTPCGLLFTASTPSGGAAPADTITAAVNIAQHPASHVSDLFSVSTPNGPFQPTLTAKPADYTLAATFPGGNLNGPSAIASDAAGNIWVTNANGNTVTELSHAGIPLSGTGFTAGLSAPSGIAIAADGSVWVTNRGNNTISHLSSAGAAYPGTPVGGGGLNLPDSIAFDASGTAWIANSGSASVTKLGSDGSLANYSSGGTGGLVSVAVSPH